MPQDPTISWLLTTAGAVVVALVVYTMLYRVALRLTRRAEITHKLVRDVRWPARIVLITVAVHLALLDPAAPEGIGGVLEHLAAITLILAIAWVAVAVGFALMDAVLTRFQIDIPDNLRARRVRTQVTVLRRVWLVVVGVIALAAILTTFPGARALGTSILASAGIAGIIAGIAAQSTLGNFIAGVQIAFSEPVRIDDVVVLEGEWGKIEEITLTYVVVRIWDHRRLVLPTSYFVKTPFQNWTRTSADLLATVTFHVDYTVPVDEVRTELKRILDDSSHWDEKAWAMQVTDSDGATMQLRALMSAPDSGTAWELRCEVREKLIGFLQRRFPESLPRVRAELAGTISADGEPRLAGTQGRKPGS